MDIVPTPFKQSQQHSDEQNGNCFATCLAILLGYDDYRDVPQWEKEEDWADYYQRYMTYLAERDLTLLRLDNHPLIKGYYIANGQTCRGTIRHACIYKDGALLYDPHPSGIGLEEVEFIELIADVGFAIAWSHKELRAEIDRLKNTP